MNEKSPPKARARFAMWMLLLVPPVLFAMIFLVNFVEAIVSP